MNKFRILTYLTLLIAFISCEEIVNPNLQTAEPVLVVDAWLTDKVGGTFVKLSTTTSFGATVAPPSITNANVIIKDEALNEYEFKQIKPGYYVPQDDDFVGESNVFYTLEVQVEDEMYSATGRIHPIEPIDSILFVLKEKVPFFEDGFYPVIYYQEEQAYDNFYYYDIMVNNEVINSNEISIFDDKVFEGQYIDLVLFHNLNLGDTVTIDLFSFSEQTYQYYLALSLLAELGSPSQTNPENPVSNISNDALGFFTVAAVVSNTAIVKEE